MFDSFQKGFNGRDYNIGAIIKQMIDSYPESEPTTFQTRPEHLSQFPIYAGMGLALLRLAFQAFLLV